MLKTVWGKLFLDQRPSLVLGMFRICVALTVGAVMLPTFMHLPDTYLSTAFKTYNTSFFPVEFIQWVQKSPDTVVIVAVGFFCVSWFLFLIGLFGQMSAIVLTAMCYYFYALNAFAMGTLSWDILLVTLVLMCATDYPNDYFSIKALWRGRADAWQQRRPLFLQRLLQIQIAFTYFYTAVHKITVDGNWITGNPIYYLMNMPRPGVVKYFLLKDVLKTQPELCYVLGLSVVAIELSMPFLLWFKRTRLSGIYLGMFFHLLLILTLDVPATFFFLFPPMLLLFIDPNDVEDWIKRKRDFYRKAPRYQLIYDGRCRFCRGSLTYLKVMDLFGRIDDVDLHGIHDFSAIHPDLSKEKALHRVYLTAPDGRLLGGFFAFRCLTLMMPMLYFLVPVFYCPGSGVIGPAVYQFIARHRYLIPMPGGSKIRSCEIP